MRPKSPAHWAQIGAKAMDTCAAVHSRMSTLVATQPQAFRCPSATGEFSSTASRDTRRNKGE